MRSISPHRSIGMFNGTGVSRTFLRDLILDTLVENFHRRTDGGFGTHM
jgi:hypothetical protein